MANVAQQGLYASRTCHQHALEVGAHIASFKPLGAGAQHRDRGRHRLAVLTGTDVAGRVGAPDDDHAEPVELVDEERERLGRAGRSRRSEGGRDKPPAQLADGVIGLIDASLQRSLAIELRLEQVGERPERARRRGAKPGPRARRPQEHRRRDRDCGRQAPALETRRDRRRRRRDVHREDEAEQRGEGARGAVAVDEAGEQDREPDHRHRARPGERAARADGAQDDQREAQCGERQVGGEAPARRALEVGQNQQGKRSEHREDRRLRVADDVVGEREHRRYHERSARCALKRCAIRVVSVQMPLDRAHECRVPGA